MAGGRSPGVPGGDTPMAETTEQRHARIVRESLRRALDHLAPGHPAGLAILRGLCAAEDYCGALAAERPDEDRVVATRWRPSPEGERPPDLAPRQS